MKSPVELNSLLSKFFVVSPGLLYHPIRRDTGRLTNEAFTSNPIVSSKQYLSGLKITNWFDHVHLLSDGTTFLFGWVPSPFRFVKKTFEGCFSFYTIFSSYTFHLYTFHSHNLHSYIFSFVYFSFVYFSFVYSPFVYFSFVYFTFVYFPSVYFSLVYFSFVNFSFVYF